MGRKQQQPRQTKAPSGRFFYVKSCCSAISVGICCYLIDSKNPDFEVSFFLTTASSRCSINCSRHVHGQCKPGEFSKMLSRVAIFFILLFGCLSISSSQSAPAPIATIETRFPALPMAIYRNITVDDLNRLLKDSFLESGFSLVNAKRYEGGITAFQFSYPIDSNGKSGSVIFEFKVDGLVVNKKCADCFLRWGKIQDEKAIDKLPWMTQYAFHRIFFNNVI